MKDKINIIEAQLGGLAVLKVENLKTNSSFSIIPDYGGCLNSYVSKGVVVLLSSNNEKELQNFTMAAFAGAQLFPFPNRIKGGIYRYLNRSFSLLLNDYPYKNALHGLIYNRPFKIENIDRENGSIKLKYHYKQDHSGYPFDLIITNTYKLSDESLSITTSIKNVGHESAPVGHGWHPYFMTPIKVDEYNLHISQVGHYMIDNELIPTGELADTFQFSDLNPIGSKKLNHCFELKEGEPSRVKLIDSTNDRTVIIDTNGYPYMQIYIPPERNCIALEPCTCIPDAFNNKIGCNYLEPGQIWELQFDIIVKSN
jgi:aldose 1-epimerase